MIRGFKCKTTQQLWEGEVISQRKRNKFGDLDWVKALENLNIINELNEKELMSIPSLRYHTLNDGRFSVDVRRRSKWRIIFQWIDEERSDCELVRISDESH